MPDQIAGGGTEWMLLDANNSNYANYAHPAYYNTTMHQVLDSASGSKVGDWILTTSSSGNNSGDSYSSADSKILYNTSTHERITPNQIAGGGTQWMILDANNSSYASYTHPAYYNTTMHQVLDSASGSKVGDWILEYSYKVTALTYLERVRNPNPEAGAEFGESDAFSVSGNFLAVGSAYADLKIDETSFLDTGVVYIFRIDSNTNSCHLTDTILPPVPKLGLRFGHSVKLDGNQLVVTSRTRTYLFSNNIQSNNIARLHLFELDENGSSSLKQTVSAPSYITETDEFGYGTEISAEFLTVAAIDHEDVDTNISSAGSLASTELLRYKIQNDFSSVIQKIDLGNTTRTSGYEIVFSEYGKRLVVGQYHHGENELAYPGRALLYNVDDSGVLTLTQEILPTGTSETLGKFGRSISQAGNILAIGEYGGLGAVHLYKFDNNGLAQPIKTITTPDSVYGWFGRSVIIKENIQGTGSLFVGAPKDGAGSIYEFYLENNGSVEFVNKVYPIGGTSGDFFAKALQQSENLLLAGAYKTDFGSLEKSGVFYTYSFSSLGLDKEKYIYNTVTQEVISGELASKPNSSPWSLLDSSKHPDYRHPAYYNSNLQQVLDSSSDASVGGWVLTNFVSGLTSSFVEIKQVEDNSSSLVLYNVDTKKVITPSEVATGSTDWLLLSPEKYPEKYTHPAYYNLTFHAVVENVEGDVEQGWTLRDSNLIDQNSSNSDISKVLYNTVSHQVITRDQIESGGTDWMALASGFVGNDGSTYAFPAYYNKQSHGVLDNTPGDSESGWILIHLNFEVKVKSTDGGKISGDGNYSKGAMANLVAEPSLGFRFDGWGGDISKTDMSIELNILSDLDINASFSKDTRDDDSDGLSNYDELVVYGTDSSFADSDQDGISDFDEINNDMNPVSSDKVMIDKISQILNSVSYGTTPYTNEWFFDEERGWIYTHKSIYPYFFDNSTKGWMYFQAGGDSPRYYHYDTKKWITFDSE